MTENTTIAPDSGGVETDVFARRLRQARLAAGLSLDQLANRLRRPVTKQALSKFESGKAKPAMTTLADLSDALGVGAAARFVVRLIRGAEGLTGRSEE